MNEATLEARLHAVLETIFPTFKEVSVTHQASFSIKFGHRNVKVDLKDPTTLTNRAIYDVLLTCEGSNIILAELKTQGHALTEEDIKQGISYARLIEQMPPVVLISNGVVTRLFDTYTYTEITEKTIDLDFIRDRINVSFQMAASDFRNAVELLLNKEPKLIGKVIRRISKENLALQMGEISNINKPIAESFQVKRRITKRLYKAVVKNENLIGLVGSAFSGKTNILYQFFRDYGYQKNIFALYVNLQDWNYSIFQHLANEFTKETKGLINKDKIRDWFLAVLNYDPSVKFVLLIDNLATDIQDEISQELIELIHIFKGSHHSIIYSVDEWNYRQKAYVPNRNYQTILGELTKLFFVRPLNDREYIWANRKLLKSSRSFIQRGGSYTPEFREPRVLRHLSALSEIKSSTQQGYIEIRPIPTFDLIESIAHNPIFTKQIHDTYKALAITFVVDQRLRDKTPYLNLIANSLGAISKAIIKKMLGEDKLLVMLKEGLVVEREYLRGLEVVLPKITELLLYHGADAVYHMLKVEKDKSLDNMYRLFKLYCGAFPASDVVGSGVLKKIGKDDVELFSVLILQLLNEEPVFETIKAGTKTLLFSEKYGYLHMNFETDMDDETPIISHLPYSILSQLAHLPMESEDMSGNRGYDAFLDIIYKIGSIPASFGRIGFGTFDKARLFAMQTIPGVGTFSSARNGTIETIVQAIESIFFSNPELIEQVFHLAKKELNYPLLWRIDLALKACVHYPNLHLQKTALLMIKDIREIFFTLFNEKTGLDIEPNV